MGAVQGWRPFSSCGQMYMGECVLVCVWDNMHHLGLEISDLTGSKANAFSPVLKLVTIFLKSEWKLLSLMTYSWGLKHRHFFFLANNIVLAKELLCVSTGQTSSLSECWKRCKPGILRILGGISNVLGWILFSQNIFSLKGWGRESRHPTFGCERGHTLFSPTWRMCMFEQRKHNSEMPKQILITSEHPAV